MFFVRIEIIVLRSKKTHSETTKDPRFNGIANAAHCHPHSSPYPKPFKQQTSFAVWLFCFSSVYESELSTQPQNKKASQLALRGFVARPGFEPGTSGL